MVSVAPENIRFDAGLRFKPGTQVACRRSGKSVEGVVTNCTFDRFSEWELPTLPYAVKLHKQESLHHVTHDDDFFIRRISSRAEENAGTGDTFDIAYLSQLRELQASGTEKQGHPKPTPTHRARTVEEGIRDGGWKKCNPAGPHVKYQRISPDGEKEIFVRAKTPSDRRAVKNELARIRRLNESGKGFGPARADYRDTCLFGARDAPADELTQEQLRSRCQYIRDFGQDPWKLGG